MKTAIPCPLDPERGHLMINQGRDEARFADTLACDCGIWRMAHTDEHQARLAAQPAPSGAAAGSAGE